MGAATAALSIPLLSVASAIARATGCSPPSVYPLFHGPIRWRAYTPGRKQPPSQAAGSGCSVRRPPWGWSSCHVPVGSRRSRGLGGADGLGGPVRISVAVGGDRVGRGQGGRFVGDAAQVGSAKSRSTAGSAPASRPRRLRAKIF